MPNENKSGIQKYGWEALTFFATITPVALLATFRTELGKWLAGKSPMALANITIALVICAIAFAVLYLRQRPWVKWDEPSGTWLNRFNHNRYCEKCRTNHSLLSPLKDEISGWRCMSCRQFYKDPARRDIDVQRVKDERRAARI